MLISAPESIKNDIQRHVDSAKYAIPAVTTRSKIKQKDDNLFNKIS